MRKAHRSSFTIDARERLLLNTDFTIEELLRHLRLRKLLKKYEQFTNTRK